jgi:hypothetical protein
MRQGTAVGLDLTNVFEGIEAYLAGDFARCNEIAKDFGFAVMRFLGVTDQQIEAMQRKVNNLPDEVKEKLVRALEADIDEHTHQLHRQKDARRTAILAGRT